MYVLNTHCARWWIHSIGQGNIFIGLSISEHFTHTHFLFSSAVGVEGEEELGTVSALGVFSLVCK